MRSCTSWTTPSLRPRDNSSALAIIQLQNRTGIFRLYVNPLNLAVAVAIKKTKVVEISRAIYAMSRQLALEIHTLIHDPEKSIANAAQYFPKRY